MRRALERASAAEAEIRELARLAKDGLSKMAARCALLDAAMRVIMKHDLLNEFSHELNHPPVAEASEVSNGQLDSEAK